MRGRLNTAWRLPTGRRPSGSTQKRRRLCFSWRGLLAQRPIRRGNRRSTEAIRIDPKGAKAYNNRGIAYASKGDYDRAITDLTEAIRLAPTFAPAYYVRGLVYSKKGEKAKAEVDFAQAKKLGLKPMQHP